MDISDSLGSYQESSESIMVMMSGVGGIGWVVVFLIATIAYMKNFGAPDVVDTIMGMMFGGIVGIAGWMAGGMLGGLLWMIGPGDPALLDQDVAVQKIVDGIQETYAVEVPVETVRNAWDAPDDQILQFTGSRDGQAVELGIRMDEGGKKLFLYEGKNELEPTQ